jgi:hypothetical protein
MFKVEFKDFRCFGDAPAIEVRPITFLVGENSAGKTSFLAGLRFVLESFSREGQNPFNHDPYFLGGFEQIAHYRGGRGGRAKAFTIALDVPGSGRTQGSRSRTIQSVRHKFEFGRGHPQPELTNYFFTAPSATIKMSFVSERPKITLQCSDRPESPLSLGEGQVPSSTLLRRNVHFISYIMDVMHFRGRISADHGKHKAEVEKSGLSNEQFSALVMSFQDSKEYLSQDVFASAPVRTQPFRTYTPSDVLNSSEGSHVPLELARTKRRSSEQWQSQKHDLEDFGRKSGLFSDIEGPSMNLVDVGYGVSQALPIIYQIQNATQYNTFLLQQPEVHLHPRAQAEIGSLLSAVAGRKTRQTMVVETHSDYIIDRVRIEVGRGALKPEDVTIVFFKRDQYSSTATNLFLDKSGEILNPPHDFRDFFLEEHSSLLGL